MKPDWRVEEDYAFTQGLSAEGWAWEFHWRNQEYQQQCRKALERFRQLQAEGEYPSYPSDPSDQRFRIPGHRFTLDEDGAPRVQFDPNLEPWGLTAYYPPDRDQPPGYRARPGKEAGAVYPWFAASQSTPWEEPDYQRSMLSAAINIYKGHALLDIDLTLPLPRQIAQAEDELRMVRDVAVKVGAIDARKPRLHPKKWVEYLRVLDAAASGTRHAEIAAVLYPALPDEYPDHTGRKKVSDQLRLARRLVDKGYLDILLLRERD